MEKSKLWMIIIIVLLVVMCVALGAGFLVVLNTINNLKLESGETTHQDLSTPQVAQSDIQMFELPSAIKSVLVPSPGHDQPMAQIEVSLGLNKTDKGYAELETLLTAQTKAIVSLIDTILRTKTFDDISTANKNSKEALEYEILTKLQEEFETNIIVKVYTTLLTSP